MMHGLWDVTLPDDTLSEWGCWETAAFVCMCLCLYAPRQAMQL